MAIFNSYVSLPEGNVANPLIYLEFGMVCTPIFGNLGMGWDVFFFLRTTLVGSKTSEKNTGRGTIQKKTIYIYIYIFSIYISIEITIQPYSNQMDDPN